MNTTWNKDDHPHLFERTKQEYIRIPLEQFELRMTTPEWVRATVDKLPEGCFLAGGFFSSLYLESKVNDIDLFFNNDDAVMETISLIRDDEFFEEYMVPDEDLVDSLLDSKTHRFIDIPFSGPDKPKIQIVKTRYYDSMDELLDSFDITAAQFGIEKNARGEMFVVCNPMAIFDLPRKRIAIHKITFAGDTLRRILKYTKKGFFACPGMLHDIAAKLSAVTPTEESKTLYID